MTTKPEEVDALLDQIESKYFSSEAKKLSQIEPKDCPCTKKEPTNWDEVDEMLKDFKFEDSNPFGKAQNKSWTRQDIERPEESSKDGEKVSKKCYATYLSGSYEPMGYCALGAEKPCDKLHCLRCDFPVVFFDNYKWEDSTDYLFLRNNIPDFDKLAVNLIRKRGTRAYACQCESLSISKLTNVLAKPNIRWVCGKHKN